MVHVRRITKFYGRDNEVREVRVDLCGFLNSMVSQHCIPVPDILTGISLGVEAFTVTRIPRGLRSMVISFMVWTL